jgi:nicotinamide-nucleotide amidase
MTQHNEIYASVLTIGDELLIGQTIDTNSAYIGRVFNELGIWVNRRVAVGDDYKSIWTALDECALHSKIIIITGGLGPTADDITKPLLCKYFDTRLVLNEEVLKNVEYLFRDVFRKPGPLLQRNVDQALVPENALVLHNALGTAPGMWFEKPGPDGEKRIFVSLPGVPFEMKGLMQQEVLPRLRGAFTFPAIAHRSVVTFGMGESAVAERLHDFEKELPIHIRLAYLPNFGMVKLRLTARGQDLKSINAELDQLQKKLAFVLDDIVISMTDEPMEEIVGKLLRARNKTLATAESCTGGHIAGLMTRIPGSSDYFKGSIVAYSNAVKENLLSVKKDTLERHGAVSEETVREMVTGALKQIGADYAVATSGIMGPDGGTKDKPVGTVWIAAGNNQRTVAKLLKLRFDRERNTEVATIQALNFLRSFIKGDE